MKKLEGKVAAVTGVGSGIGRALAVVLAKKGCELSLNEINQDRLDETITIRNVKVKLKVQQKRKSIDPHIRESL